MLGDLLLIVDDASSVLNLGGGQWSNSTETRWYGGSSVWPKFAVGNNGDTGAYGSLNYTFHGTSIAFMGDTPLSKNTQTVTVTIDENLPYNASYDDPNPQNYRQWYQSPHLDDGVHTIQLDNIAGTSVDFMVVSSGPSTPLAGQKIIVDDDDPSIIYSGDWTRNRSPYYSAEPPNGLPFRNGTHQSMTPGDTAIVRFTGSSIALYGIFSWTALGSMSVMYTLDGSSSIITYDVDPSTPEFVNHMIQSQNHLFFSNDSLAPGDHTLSINVTRADNLTFVMDYLTYSPSFASLATKPNFTAPVTPTSPVPVTSASTSMTTGPSSARPAASKNRSGIGGIIGGVVGAVVALMLVLFIIHNRRRRHQFFCGAGPESGHQTSGIEPYLLTLPSIGSNTKSGSSANNFTSHPNSRHCTANDPQQLNTRPQTEAIRRIRAAEALITELGTESGSDGISHENQAEVRRPRRRIEDLTRDSSRRSGESPPAYDSGP
ncbi:hypothetical protein BD779DRAFT_1474887 [Infundibulicybe gibba]|nr:hypothetical protein BD779DRAFT_1474887 [Infundibulicybe gibba]